MEQKGEFVRGLKLRGLPGLSWEDEMDNGTVKEIARVWLDECQEEDLAWINGVVTSFDPVQGEHIQQIRDQIYTDYKENVFKDQLGHLPPKRGPLGEAVIETYSWKPAVKQRPFSLAGDRREGLIKIIEGLVAEGKIEEG